MEAQATAAAPAHSLRRGAIGLPQVLVQSKARNRLDLWLHIVVEEEVVGFAGPDELPPRPAEAR